MFCPKCGANLPNDAGFCSNCGTNLKKFASNNSVQNNNEETMTEMLSKKSHAFFNPIVSKVKAFINKNKKYTIIGTISILIIIVLLIIYGKVFGFEKLSWKKEYDDYILEYVSQSKVILGIDFSDEKKVDQLKIKTSCGNYKLKGLDVEWDLTDVLGKCRIEVNYKLRKIKKDITVINYSVDKKELSFEYTIDYDSDEDLDLDGLTNKQEKEYGTNPELFDTDMDGLDDYYELFTSKTDPLKADTDGDGLNDYDEIELELDPLKVDSKGDGIKDGNRKVSYSIKNEESGIMLDVSGTGNIPSSTINTFKNTTFEETNGLLDTVYNFYTSGKIDNATVSIAYSVDEINAKEISEDNLTLYYFNEKTKELELIPTTVDKANKTVTAILTHFSKYVIGDKNTVLTTKHNQILMVIDNSVSMYTYDQLTELGYTSITGADGNDKFFKRLSLTNNLIDMFSGYYYFGISEFAGNYVSLQKFTDNHIAAKNAVNSIKNDLDNVGDGTNIVNALNKGISEFLNNDYGHYLILITDGKDTSTYNTLSSNKNTIISNAKSKDIKICVIGLGTSLDTDDLKSIAEETGCSYYNASDSGALDEVYSIIGADINYNLVDTNGDGNVDGTIIADSGFIVTRDGFSFRNYGTNLSQGGHCYGMATIAELYYTKTLPMTLGSKTVNRDTLISKNSDTSYAYNLNGTYFSTFNNLYNYKLKTNALKHNFGFDLFNEEKPKDYMTLSGNTLVYNQIYKDEIINSGLYDISISKSALNSSQQLAKWGVNYYDAENISFNEDKMQTSSVIDKTDKELFNAIYAAFIRQNDIEFYTSSSANLFQITRNALNAESSTAINSAAFIDLLTTRINNGDVPVISARYSTGLHAINAISLVQDNEDANHYYIGVYDNNYPGEKRYVDIRCNNLLCVTKANDYYTRSNEPIRITASLEYDLEYFK